LIAEGYAQLTSEACNYFSYGCSVPDSEEWNLHWSICPAVCGWPYRKWDLSIVLNVSERTRKLRDLYKKCFNGRGGGKYNDLSNYFMYISFGNRIDLFLTFKVIPTTKYQ
jgi:hypothetical protein